MTLILPPERPYPESLCGLGAYASMETEMSQEKWVLNSLTMWGAFVTAISASLPSLNTFIVFFFGDNWSIEPGWVEAMDSGVKAVIQGVGALVGLVMVVYGRWTAKAELTVAKP